MTEELTAAADRRVADVTSTYEAKIASLMSQRNAELQVAVAELERCREELRGVQQESSAQFAALTASQRESLDELNGQLQSTRKELADAEDR